MTQETVIIRAKGIRGPAGPQGPAGPKGDSGTFDVSQVSFIYEQQSNSTTWNITHNLGFVPNIMVMDYGQNNIECDIEYDPTDTLNKVILHFSDPISGHAYLS